MSTHSVSYTEARANVASLWDRVVAEPEPVVIQRRGKEDVAMIPASELDALLKTAHLLRSPRNADRLLRARGHAPEASTVDAVRADVGLE